jgi:hypothetical protein
MWEILKTQVNILTPPTDAEKAPLPLPLGNFVLHF